MGGGERVGRALLCVMHSESDAGTSEHADVPHQIMAPPWPPPPLHSLCERKREREG